MGRMLTFVRNLDIKMLAIATVTGVCLGVGTLFFNLWPLSLLGFAGVVYILRDQAHKATWSYLALTGTIAYGCSFYPLFWSTLPLDWLGLGPKLGIAIISSVWLLTVLLFAASFSLVLSLAKHHLHNTWTLLLLPVSLYVLADALGTFLFSVFFSGPGGTIGLDFSMGSLGYQLADSELLRQFAWFGGLYALLWVQAFLGTLLYLAVFVAKGRQRILWTGVWCVVWLLLSSNFISLGAANNDGSNSLLVGVVSTYDEVQAQSTRTEQIMRSLELLPTKADVVVLPEDVRFIHTLGGSSARIEQTKRATRYLLDSTTISNADGLTAETQLLDTSSMSIATSSKDFLMVFGEYVPWVYRGIGRMIGQSDVVEYLVSEREYSIKQSNMFTIDQTVVSAKLCSDGMSPFLYARDAQAGAQVLFNLASHGWFHQSQLMHDVSVRVGQVRAVESSRWYVRSGHDSPGYIIDHRGQVQFASRWFEEAPAVAQVSLRSVQTPYSQLRGWVLGIPLLLVLMLVYPAVRARIADRRNKS